MSIINELRISAVIIALLSTNQYVVCGCILCLFFTTIYSLVSLIKTIISTKKGTNNKIIINGKEINLDENSELQIEIK